MGGEFLKEKDGKTSFTRITGLVLVLFYMFWASYLMYKDPTEFVDVPATLAMLIAGLYGINKIFSGLEQVIVRALERKK